MARIELIICDASQVLTYTVGRVYDEDDRVMASETGNNTIETHYLGGDVLRVSRGVYFYRFKFSRPGAYGVVIRDAATLELLDHAYPCDASQILEGWTYRFVV